MYLSLLFVLLLSSYSFADSISPSAHAPIGVMGEHVHKKGEVMVSYRYRNMQMDGNRVGSTRVSAEEVLDDFPVTPTDMTMEMHMFGLMFAPSDNLTLVAMLPYTELSMNHVTRMGTRFRTSSAGIGDIKLGGLYNLIDSDSSNLIANFSVSLPSGEIDETFDTPAQDDAQLPYPMQLGSGTVDLIPGITFTDHFSDLRFPLSWGFQGIGTIRTDRNDNSYSLGDRFDSSIWSALDLSHWLSVSLRSTWSIWGNVDGADPLLNPSLVPTADPNLRGGRRADLGFGLNLLHPTESFRLALEFLTPVYQNLNGPQLETDRAWVFGAQYTF